MRAHASRDAVLLMLMALLAAPAALAGSPTLPGFEETVVASGFNAPTAIAFLPDGRMLVTEQGGALYVVSGGSPTLLTTIPVPVSCINFETGLLGLAVDPAFESNGYIYLYRTNDNGNPCSYPPHGWTNEVVRVTIGPGDTVDLGSLTPLLTGIKCDTGYHNGGGLRVGPDGKLYIGVGDQGNGDFGGGGPGTSTNIYAQDLGVLEGKLLRINIPDGSIPHDNPYANQAGKREEVWAFGFRNPWRFGFDPTAGTLWLGDVGEDNVEEIDVIVKGGNYSWPHCEGNQPIACRHPGEVPPVFPYDHPIFSRGAVMGGGISGCSFGAYAGYYFFGDFELDTISLLQVNATHDGVVGGSATFVTNASSPVDVVFGPDGALYYLAFYAGEVLRVAPLGGGSGQSITGKELLLKDGGVKGSRKVLQVLSLDPAIGGFCGPGDPTVKGATVHVTGAGFDDAYTLPASGWTATLTAGVVTAYRYKDADQVNGPITSALFKVGKIKVLGKGPGLGHLVGDTPPGPVDVSVAIGTRHFCMSFGGTPKFTPSKLFKATKAAAPAVCP